MQLARMLQRVTCHAPGPYVDTVSIVSRTRMLQRHTCDAPYLLTLSLHSWLVQGEEALSQSMTYEAVS